MLTGVAWMSHVFFRDDQKRNGRKCGSEVKFNVEFPRQVMDFPIISAFFFSLQCEYRYNELLALRLARKEHIAEIITFYGAKIKGKHAFIFMELMGGEDN